MDTLPVVRGLKLRPEPVTANPAALQRTPLHRAAQTLAIAFGFGAPRALASAHEAFERAENRWLLSSVDASISFANPLNSPPGLHLPHRPRGRTRVAVDALRVPRLEDVSDDQRLAALALVEGDATATAAAYLAMLFVESSTDVMRALEAEMTDAT